MDLTKLKVSGHAKKTYGERINKHGKKAIDYFKEILPLSNPVGKIIGDDNRLAGNCKTCSTYSDDIKIKFDKTVVNLHMNNCEHVYSMGEVKLENAPKGEDGQLRVKVGFNSYHETDK